MQKMQAGDYAGAISEFSKLLETEDLFDPLFYLAHCWTKLGAHGKALGMMKKAIEQRPQSCVAHFNLGSLLQSCGREDEAMTAFRKARELTATDGSVDTRHMETSLRKILGPTS